MPSPINNFDDTIDSREIIDRIAELEDDLENGPYEEFILEQLEKCIPRDEIDAFDTWLDNTAETTDLSADDCEELIALRDLRDEADGVADWKYGATLIRESYFKDYAQQLAEDIGAINHEAGWPNNCIDWDRAARELTIDYTEIDFDGVTYLVRS